MTAQAPVAALWPVPHRTTRGEWLGYRLSASPGSAYADSSPQIAGVPTVDILSCSRAIGLELPVPSPPVRKDRDPWGFAGPSPDAGESPTTGTEPEGCITQLKRAGNHASTAYTGYRALNDPGSLFEAYSRSHRERSVPDALDHRRKPDQDSRVGRNAPAAPPLAYACSCNIAIRIRRPCGPSPDPRSTSSFWPCRRA